MKTVINHLEYKIKSLSESVMQCKEENARFKEEWGSTFNFDDYELVDKSVVDSYLLEIAEYEKALSVLITVK